MKQQQRRHQAGFTILELMIATVVVSIILLMVTSVMINLQNLYNKGVNQENIQNNVRDITNTVAQQIQSATLSEGTLAETVAPVAVATARVNGVPYTVYATCIGSARYVYVINLQVGSETKQALWQDTYPPGNCASGAPNIITASPTDDGVSYIPSGARLTDFEVIPPLSTPGSDPNFTVYVSAAIGTDGTSGTVKLLNLNDLGTANHNSYGARCITTTSDQFCATAGLSTEVGQRVE